MNFRTKILTLFLVISSTVYLDFAAKDWAIETLKDKPPRIYFWGLFSLLYAENKGAWGSIGSDLSDPLRFGVLTVLPLIFLAWLTVFILKNSQLKFYELVCYSLIFSGGIANMAGRLNRGYVVDLFYVGYGRVGTNIFNLADVWIMIGVISLIVLGRVTKRKKSTETTKLIEPQVP
jgi:signal peptidase II